MCGKRLLHLKFVSFMSFMLIQILIYILDLIVLVIKCRVHQPIGFQTCSSQQTCLLTLHYGYGNIIIHLQLNIFFSLVYSGPQLKGTMSREKCCLIPYCMWCCFKGLSKGRALVPYCLLRSFVKVHFLNCRLHYII